MKNIKNILILVLTAAIWGCAFVAQTTGGNAIGPYSFNAIRSFIGAIVLLPVIKFLDSKKLSGKKPSTKDEWKSLLIGGICCGLCLGIASIFQQLGLYYGTPAGKAGFLTTCYIIMVPILGIFLKKKCGWIIWAAVGVTLFGLYLLCINGSFALQRSDVLVLICSIIYAGHILTIDHFVQKCDPVRMSCIQFVVAGILSSVPMFFSDMHHSMEGFWAWLPTLASYDAWIALLYAGVMSSGVAYTLQIVGQIGFNPTLASLIMSLESVFSVLAGWLILKQNLSVKELIGCLLIFVAVIMAQLPEDIFRRKA